jgi:hypothetical protein
MRHKQHFHRAPTETRSGGPPKIVCLFESSTVVMVTQEEEVCTQLINKQQQQQRWSACDALRKQIKQNDNRAQKQQLRLSLREPESRPH